MRLRKVAERSFLAVFMCFMEHTSRGLVQLLLVSMRKTVLPRVQVPETTVRGLDKLRARA